MDKGNFVFIYFFLNGCGVLLPWNAILSTLDYFNFYMPTYNPGFVFPLAVNFLQLFMMFVVSIVAGKLSYNFKIGVMYLFTAVLTIILPFWPYMLKDEGVAFWICIVNLLMFGLCVSFLQASGFGFSGVLPGKYIGIFMVGQGVSGVGMNVIRLISEFIFDPHLPEKGKTPDQIDPKHTEFKGAITSYVIATAFLIGVAFMQFAVSRNEFANYYLNLAKQQNSDQSALLDDGKLNKSELTNNVDTESQNRVYEAKRSKAGEEGSVSEMLSQLKRAVSLASTPFLCMWGVFVVTFIGFPGLCLSMGLEFMSTEAKFTPITVIIIFNTLDTCGR